ncbi:type VI secretion system Vgr family protein [Roseivivax isoporae]|uniref:Uncharacterized protein n=1 Tax=Roseivivax isoporae LMG 25204 TaxID=1449351 RepID=X7F3W2_9RHOB|nr:type VI secretion system tip protein TssI/VgrG [Roseivivax isoporae]ETX26754.1 hypothetical protein RISW2_19405 [Roseivivax isoporae LMG 25204]
MIEDGRIARLSGKNITEAITPEGTIVDLRFARLVGHDEVSSCFCFELTAFSSNFDLDPLKYVGEEVCVTATTDVTHPDDERHFSGMVDRMSFDSIETGSDGYITYKLILRPHLWLLSKESDNRIFQGMTVPEIVSAVLKEHAAIRFELRLKKTYPVRTYCVQYGESTLDFLQRILEHEGIFYFFEYDLGHHTVVLSDDAERAKPAPRAEVLRFEPNDSLLDGSGVITSWHRTTSVVTGQHAQTDYDFERPGADLMSVDRNPRRHLHDDLERYDYPGAYVAATEGDRLTGIRLDQDQRGAVEILCDSTASGPAAGSAFKLADHPRDLENDAYFIVRAEYRLHDPDYRAFDAPDEEAAGFSAHYHLVPKTSQWKPGRTTPRPVMKGPQTAVVVGPPGEEIYTDKYSRVKVHFHWDRLGTRDEMSSCWVRVSAAWAGSGWGFIQIPRIGQEVIVDFLEGDPDQPIITGRVYNAEQMPPYDLPGEATKSGWKSNSSKGGGGWNELMFEDKKGSELVYFQAEKDHDELVKNNETRHIGNDWSEEVVRDARQWVGHNRDESVDNNKTTTVGVDRTVMIGNNDTETVGVNRALTVGANETIAVGVNSSETIGAHHVQTVGATQTITVAMARIDTVGAVETRSVGAAQVNTIGATRQMSVGLGQSHDIGQNDSWEIGGGQSVEIAKDQAIEVGKSHSLSVAEDSTASIGKNLSFTVSEDTGVTTGKNLVLKAGDSITLVCGSAKIQMQKDGSISIEGKDITVTGSGKIIAKASSDMVLKGSKINQN